MRILGVIAEYNPFYSGHAAHLEKAKQAYDADYIVAVMSGNFTQRGEPAIFDKWTRARAALMNGIDACIELPTEFSRAAAGYFAWGAVALLDSIGADAFVFGAETPDINLLLEKIKLENDESEIKRRLRAGYSYPRAINADSKIEAPNDILAKEYLRALACINSQIKPIAVKRSFGQAKEIRRAILNNSWNDEYSGFFADATPVNYDSLSSIVAYLILNSDLESFSDMSSELAYRFKRIIRDKPNVRISELIVAAKTKNYTRGRISRALLALILGISKEKMAKIKSPPKFARVLAIKEQKKSPLLGLLSKRLPIMLRAKDAAHFKPEWQEDKYTEIYSIAAGRDYNEYKQRIFDLKEIYF